MIRSLKLAKHSVFLKAFLNFGSIKFNLPDLGQKIKEGTIKKLYVKQGDQVTQFQKIADVASDKQFTEITASDSGIIKKIHYNEEDICQVGSLFLEIYVSDGKKLQSQTNVSHEVKTQKVQSSSEASNISIKQKQASSTLLATPYVRGLIKHYKLNIEDIEGTGPQGRITQSDVFAIATGKKEPKRIPSIKFGKRTKTPQQTLHEQKIQQQQKPSFDKKGFHSIEHSQVIKMSLFEKGMQKSMTAANSIPHLYYHEQIDLTECEKLRKALKTSNKKVTVMGLLIKTFSMALKKYPKINSTYHPSINQFEYKTHYNHNISIAIDSPNGLVVPNLKNVQTLNLLNIQQEIERLRQLSIEGKLTSHDLNHGTVCISNIGTIGGIMANPLILPPQVCIVAIGKLQAIAKWKGESWIPRSIINVSFGCDHRIIDGATVAKFTNQWKTLLQNPYLAIAEMI